MSIDQKKGHVFQNSHAQLDPKSRRGISGGIYDSSLAGDQGSIATNPRKGDAL